MVQRKRLASDMRPRLGTNRYINKVDRWLKQLDQLVEDAKILVGKAIEVSQLILTSGMCFNIYFLLNIVYLFNFSLAQIYSPFYLLKVTPNLCSGLLQTY